MLNRFHRIISLLIAAVPFMVILPASARPVRIWTWQELHEQADLVIIGTVSASSDAKNNAYPHAKSDTWVAVDTAFQVEAVLKGDLKSETVEIRHHRYFQQHAEIEVIDGPSFVEFLSKLKRRYLIFLRHNAHGSYEPLTGQYVSVGSFFLLQEYHISQERETKSERAKSDTEESAVMDSAKSYP